MAVSFAHCMLMKEVGAFADRQWQAKGQTIAGERGYKGIEYLAVKSSHPALPIFTCALGTLPALSNGLLVDLWGQPDPLCIPMQNVNHSQTRKSRLTSLSENMIGVADEHVSKQLREIHKRKVQALDSWQGLQKRKKQRTGNGESDHGKEEDKDDKEEEKDGQPRACIFPGVWSLAFLGGTIERVKERCAGDFSTTKQNKAIEKLPPLSLDVTSKELPKLTEAEKAIAHQPG